MMGTLKSGSQHQQCCWCSLLPDSPMSLIGQRLHLCFRYKSWQEIKPAVILKLMARLEYL
uniref:Uncharacterized protein n=1 Tax=Anguilla anguilla TaxID=7936 RepID=A0A0E9WKM4_ANGAN